MKKILLLALLTMCVGGALFGGCYNCGRRYYGGPYWGPYYAGPAFGVGFGAPYGPYYGPRAGISVGFGF